ncbi:hypothetical protein [Enterocloster clostridioformis]|nr:hypothetical protein [Enterocloster clostridioformis]
MQVQEFMEKHGISESRVRIYDAELGKRAYQAGSNMVLEVASVNG